MTSYIDPDNDPSLHRLEGSSGNEVGGLIIMKKGPAGKDDTHVFKKPAVSLLGLDKLADAKRKSGNDTDNVKRKSKVTSYKDENDYSSSSSSDDDDDDDNDRQPKKSDRKDRYIMMLSLIYINIHVVILI